MEHAMKHFIEQRLDKNIEQSLERENFCNSEKISEGVGA